MRNLLAVSLVAALAACTGERAAPSDADVQTQPAPAANETQASPPSPPAASEAAPGDSTAQVAGPTPAAGAITYAGFGPARFGATEEQVRMAWGKELQADPVDSPEACHYLQLSPRSPEGYRLAFMIDGGKFARMDVDTADIAAPGGGRIGMSKDEIGKLYAGIEERPHKYTDGLYLRIKDPAGGNGVLLFETDGKSGQAKVVEWRVGVPPQVDYVEGCS